MTRARWAVLVAAAVAASAWLLVGYWSSIWPNLAASLIWGTPALVTHHLLIRRHVDRRHEERLQEQHAQHLENRARLDAMAKKVGELHDFHVRGVLPDHQLRPWLHPDEPEPGETPAT